MCDTIRHDTIRDTSLYPDQGVGAHRFKTHWFSFLFYPSMYFVDVLKLLTMKQIPNFQPAIIERELPMDGICTRNRANKADNNAMCGILRCNEMNCPTSSIPRGRTDGKR